MKEDFNNYLDLIRLDPEMADHEIDSIFKSAFLELCDEQSDFNIWCSYTYFNVTKTHELHHDMFPNYYLLITRDFLNSPYKPILISEVKVCKGIPYSSEYTILLDKNALKEVISNWFNSMISLLMNK